MNYINFIKNEMDHTYHKNSIIQNIFKDHWDDLLISEPNLPIRNVVKHEIPKFLMCGSKDNGYSYYECDDCGNYLYVPFTCKSRFCPSCGVNSAINRVDTMLNRCIDISHRHITFTISDLLWRYFRKNRYLINELFEAVSYTLLSWFKDQSKSEQFTPGIILSLHTFGRDLKWNVHIHALVTEGAAGKFTTWKKFDYFPFSMLRKRFMTRLLVNLSKHITSIRFKELKSQLYSQYDNGFYVHAPKIQFTNVKLAIAYITRYSNKPPMAQSRITNYDGEFISFYYTRHDDNQLIKEKITAFEFIKRLIIHIPERYFNVVRYYGLYAIHKTKTRHFKRIQEYLTKPLKWSDKIFKHFNRNPLKCSCGNTLKFQFIVERKSQQFFQLLYPHLS